MFVGEGPGADEDAQGLPFVGRAGQLLNNMIAAMGLKREEVYIANVVKCRPPGNRTPEPDEANTCSPFLFRQIDVVRPEVLVALGATAATYLLGQRQPLAGLRGRVHSLRGSQAHRHLSPRLPAPRSAPEKGSLGRPADRHARTRSATPQPRLNQVAPRGSVQRLPESERRVSLENDSCPRPLRKSIQRIVFTHGPQSCIVAAFALPQIPHRRIA